jgi:hypothetical protein
VPGAVLPPTPKYDTYDYNDPLAPDCHSYYHLWGITYRRLRSLIFTIPPTLRVSDKYDWVHLEMSFPYYLVSKILELSDLYLFGDEVSIRHYYWLSMTSLLFLSSVSLVLAYRAARGF